MKKLVKEMAPAVLAHPEARTSPLNHRPHHFSTESPAEPRVPVQRVGLVKEGRLEDLAFAPNDWVDAYTLVA